MAEAGRSRRSGYGRRCPSEAVSGSPFRSGVPVPVPVGARGPRAAPERSRGRRRRRRNRKRSRQPPRSPLLPRRRERCFRAPPPASGCCHGDRVPDTHRGGAGDYSSRRAPRRSPGKPRSQAPGWAVPWGTGPCWPCCCGSHSSWDQRGTEPRVARRDSRDAPPPPMTCCSGWEGPRGTPWKAGWDPSPCGWWRRASPPPSGSFPLGSRRP